MPAASQQRVARSVQGNVIVAGPSGVGKTCLLERFVHGVYDDAEGPTIGCDCHKKSVFVDGREVHLNLYDTAGQERYANMFGCYFRNAHVCLLCYDMSELTTFDSTVRWDKQLAQHNPTCLRILVGTKQDKVDQQGNLKSEFESADCTKVMKKISEWAEERRIPHVLTSALQDGAAVDSLFHAVAEKCLRLSCERHLAAAAPERTVKLTPSSIKQLEGQCCR